MVTPVILGLECCASVMYLLHLWWMRTAALWHALLFPVEGRVCPSGVFPQFFLLCSTSLVDRDSVSVFVYELLDELEDPVVSERVFLDHRDCGCGVGFVFEFLCVGWGCRRLLSVECRVLSLLVAVVLWS